MSDSCCAASTNQRPTCPACKVSGYKINISTIFHHLKMPWKTDLTVGEWGSCESDLCDVIYFQVDGQKITTNQIREIPAFKKRIPEAMLCNCFGVSLGGYQAASTSDQQMIRDWITERTRNRQCACDVRNPGGRCCLKDFKHFS